MKHVVNISGGVCSHEAARRVIQRHGAENVTLLFADTLMEDEDLYRFLSQSVARLFGWGAEVPGFAALRQLAAEVGEASITPEGGKGRFVIVSDGRSPWDLFEQKRMLGNNHFPLCSVMLKREVLDQWRAANCDPADTVVHIGIDWTESHRLEQTRRALPEWRVEAPCCEEPLWDKCRMLAEVRALGIEPPRLYGMGFPHNNCGGFCVKAGQAHFAHLLRTMPERYAFHEAKEEGVRAASGKDYSILRDRRGGKLKPLTLRQLRERIEAGESFDRHDWGGCGCSVDLTPPSNTQPNAG